jgi:hypothetical protein
MVEDLKRFIMLLDGVQSINENTIEERVNFSELIKGILLNQPIKKSQTILLGQLMKDVITLDFNEK